MPICRRQSSSPIFLSAISPTPKAFTLVELLAVIAIAALILGGGLAITLNIRANALRQQTVAILAATAAELEAARAKSGEYPNTIATLDSWQTALIYNPSAENYTLASTGPDTIANTPDDITYAP